MNKTPFIMLYAAEIVDGNWDIERLPASIKDDVLELVKRQTGKEPTKENFPYPAP